MAWIEGEKVGGYILGRQLGQGGMATVYLGHHPELDRRVAIKVMHQNFLEDEGFVARFKREAQIVARLTHPHIVPVYDFAEHKGQPYLVMKYIQGWTLKKQLIKNPPDLEGIVEIMGAIGDALTYAHSQGVLHRDIKPSNIVIDGEGIPYLTDFGLARLSSSGESTMSADMLLGTPHYISPEQARGTKELDGRTDIYSLGIVLYELMVGKVPFTGDSAYSIVHDHIYTQLPAPTVVNPELPPPVEDVLYKALAKNPKDRYETANDLIEDMRQAINRGDLTELDPDRATVAEASLAKIRAEYTEYDDQPTITPYVGVGSPVPQGSSVRKAKIYERPVPFYDQPRFWVLSGCGSLIVILFISFSVLIGMSSNFQEFASLSLGDETSEQDPRMAFVDTALNTLVATSNYDVSINREQNFPLIEASYVPVEELPNNIDTPIVTALYVRSYYETGDIDQAREVAMDASYDDDTLRGISLLSSATVAARYDDQLAATIFAILGSEAVEGQPFIDGNAHHVATKLIYDNASMERLETITSTLRTLLEAQAIDTDVIDRLEASDLVLFATVRNLIANENVRLARNALDRVSEDTLLSHEFALLKAELVLLVGSQEDAESILDDILGSGDAPRWIVGRVREIEDQLQ